MNKTTKEKQHTVPQFILRNFSIKNRLYTYDKYTGKIYCSNVANSGCERSFYDFEIKTNDKLIKGTIEEKLCEIEYKASSVIRKILDGDTVVNITDKEKNDIVYFLAVQMVRTPNVKHNYKSMPEQLRNAIRKRMPNLGEGDILDEKLPNFDDSDFNLFFDMLIADSTERLRGYFDNLEWILVKTDEMNPFLIGDSPVVVYNELYHDEKESLFFSKYSIAYKGCCIFFPITPTRALWLVDPEVIDKYAKLTKTYLSLIFLGIKSAKDLEKVGMKIKYLLDREFGLTKTKVFVFSTDDVTRYNYYQIISAERKVFSKFSDFKQAEEIIKSNEFYKHGKRMMCY